MSRGRDKRDGAGQRQVADDVAALLGEGEAGVDLQGTAGGVAAIGRMSAPSIPRALSRVNRERLKVCGLIEAVVPAARFSVPGPC